jgi:hypothetical protein
MGAKEMICSISLQLVPKKNKTTIMRLGNARSAKDIDSFLDLPPFFLRCSSAPQHPCSFPASK